MPEWEEKKFQGLLTSNIWHSSAEEIKIILEMPEWEEEKFQGLLTSNIWKSSAEEIKRILEMPEWKDQKYAHLLQPSIFNLSLKNIRPTIELFKEYGIDEFVSNCALRRNVNTQKRLLIYMQKNGIPFLKKNLDGSYKLSKIINSSNADLKKKYHIDLNEIENNCNDILR